MDQIFTPMNRRLFLGQSARGAGLAMAGVAAAKLVTPANAASVNPFALNLARVSKTNPDLVQYQQERQFSCPDAEPRRISLGSDKLLYIASAKQVSAIDPAGTLVRVMQVPSPARCVCVDNEGTVFAGLKDRVEVFGARGERQASWEPLNSRSWISSIAAGDTDVFVADAGNRVVLRYDKSGKVRGRIGEKNLDKRVPGLIVPSPYLDVALGKDGLLRVNNPGRHCVELFTAEGDLELSWGKPSAAITGFCGCCNPVGIDVLADGSHVTCEKGLPRVKLYSAQGDFAGVVAGVESFPENARTGANAKGPGGVLGGLDAAVGDDGTIFVLDLIAANVRVMRKKA